MNFATATGFFRHLDAGKWADIGQATLDTLLMLAGSLPLTMLIGLPLGPPPSRPSLHSPRRWARGEPPSAHGCVLHPTVRLSAARYPPPPPVTPKPASQGATP